MDPFDDDDLFETSTTPAVRAGGKFQPKVKFCPKKGISRSVLSEVLNEAKEKVGILSSPSVDTTQYMMPDDVANDKLEDSVGSILAISAIKSGEQSLKTCEDQVGLLEDVRNSKAAFSEVASSRMELIPIGKFCQEVAFSSLTKPENEAYMAGVDADSVIDGKSDPAIANSRISSTQEISSPKQLSLFVSTKEKHDILISNALDTAQSVQLGDAGKAAEVDIIQHLDPFDDVLSKYAARNACAGQRFRPKTKPQNRKGTCIVDTSVPPTMHPSTSSSMESFYVGAHGGTVPLATSVILGSREPSKNNEFTSYVPFSDKACNLGVAIVAPDLEVAVPDENGEFRKSAGEFQNVDIFAGLESLDDFHTRSSDANEHLGNTFDIAAASERRACKFKPKPKMKNGKEKPSVDISQMESASSMPLQADDMVSCETAYVQEGSIPGSPGVDVLGCSSARCDDAIPSNQAHKIAGNAQETDLAERTHPDTPVLTDVVYSVDISRMSGKVDGKSGTGKAYVASNPPRELTSTVNDAVGGGKMSKQLRKQSAQQLVVEPVQETDELNKYKDSNDECRSKSLLPPRKRRTCSTFSKAVGDGKISRQIRKLLVDQPVEEPGDESTDVNDSTYESLNTCAKKYKGVVDESKASDPPRKFKTSKDCEEVRDKQTTRQLRKRSAEQLVAEPSSEFHDINASTDEPFSGNTDEYENNDDKFSEDSVSKKKKAPRKPKKPVSKNKKSVKKRKSASDTPDESTIKPPKKFSCSSRRNRNVDKILLDMPEDEIDPLKVPIKDLLRLADYRERLQSKETLKSRSQLTNQSADNPFYEEASRDEDSLNMGVGGEFNDEQTTSRPTSGTYVNYQSFMYKTPSTRWSKQDTKLFYEAVQQFGTDFSMIQQCFPGRTRRQVMLKFKREERERRLQLDEAVTNRAKDHSHFEYVMQRLQQAAAQAKGQNENESTRVAGEEDVEELMHDANDEGTKSEANEKIKNVEADVAESQGPLEAEEIFDDPDRWNNYNY